MREDLVKNNKCQICGRENIYMLAYNGDDCITLRTEVEKYMNWFEFRITDGSYESISMFADIHQFRDLVKTLNEVLKQYPEPAEEKEVE